MKRERRAKRWVLQQLDRAVELRSAGLADEGNLEAVAAAPQAQPFTCDLQSP